MYLTLEPEIAQAMVFGDRHPYLVAVLVPDPDLVAGYATQDASAADLVALAADPGFTKAVGAAVGYGRIGSDSPDEASTEA